MSQPPALPVRRVLPTPGSAADSAAAGPTPQRGRGRGVRGGRGRGGPVDPATGTMSRGRGGPMRGGRGPGPTAGTGGVPPAVAPRPLATRSATMSNPSSASGLTAAARPAAPPRTLPRMPSVTDAPRPLPAPAPSPVAARPPAPTPGARPSSLNTASAPDVSSSSVASATSPANNSSARPPSRAPPSRAQSLVALSVGGGGSGGGATSGGPPPISPRVSTSVGHAAAGAAGTGAGGPPPISPRTHAATHSGGPPPISPRNPTAPAAVATAAGRPPVVARGPSSTNLMSGMPPPKSTRGPVQASGDAAVSPQGERPGAPVRTNSMQVPRKPLPKAPNKRLPAPPPGKGAPPPKPQTALPLHMSPGLARANSLPIRPGSPTHSRQSSTGNLSMSSPRNTISLKEGSGGPVMFERRAESSSSLAERPISKCDVADDNHRKQIVTEIYTTEQKYVGALLDMSERYRRPLNKLASDPESGVTRDDIKVIFANVEQIRNVNVELFKQISTRYRDWDSTTLIGDAFMDVAPFLKMYTVYGSNYEHGEKRFLDLLSSNKRMAEVIAQADKGHDLKLPHLLIMPVQRIPRYNLLLADLIRQTPTDHPDYENLLKAHEATSAVATHLNKMVRQAENIKLLSDKSGKGRGLKTLLRGHTHLISEGLFLVDSSTKLHFGGLGKQVLEKMHLFLFNDQLVVARKDSVKKQEDIAKAGICAPHNLVWIGNEESDTLLTIFIPNRSLLVHFTDSAERAKWVAQLDETINDYMKQRMSEQDLNSRSEQRTGRFTFKNGATFEGSWLNGLPSGEGVFIDGGNSYDGEWKEGERSGMGRLTYHTDDRYEGQFEHDLPNGYGKFISRENVVYTGHFVSGQFSGSGSMEWPNGDTLEANWEDGFVCGHGVLKKTSIGLTYEGAFRDDLFEGNGTMQSATGKCYVGNWEHGVRKGFGKMDFGNGITYEGNWLANKFHGKGTLVNTVDGSVLDGKFVGGHFEKGKVSYANGDVYEGRLMAGQAHGKGTMTYGCGDVYQGHFKLGRYHGHGVLTFDNGTRWDGTWTQGQRDGKFQVELNGNVFTASCKADQVLLHVEDRGVRAQLDVSPRFHVAPIFFPSTSHMG